MKEDERTVENWETIAVTALPAGWRNVYKDAADGSTTAWACPAILLQEHRSDTTYWDEPNGDGTYRLCERTAKRMPPYETRAVFASSEAGWLDPADATGNYVGTVGPDEDPERAA